MWEPGGMKSRPARSSFYFMPKWYQPQMTKGLSSCCASTAWMPRLVGVLQLRHGGFISGGRTATFSFPELEPFIPLGSWLETCWAARGQDQSIVYWECICRKPPARGNTNIFVDYKEVLLSVRGNEGSQITSTPSFLFNKINCACLRLLWVKYLACHRE